MHGGQDLGFVAAYNRYHIAHVNVNTFHHVPVGQLMVSVMFGEICVYELRKLLGNISFNVQVEWWIKPNHFPFAPFVVK